MLRVIQGSMKNGLPFVLRAACPELDEGSKDERLQATQNRKLSDLFE